MNNVKKAEQDFIIAEAIKMFFERPIADVTMVDIAREIGLGEATLYRYFGKKSNIVIRAAEKLSVDVYLNYYRFDETKSGYERIKDFYEAYLKVFEDNKNYYSFINSFDNFIASEKIDLTAYNQNVNAFKTVFDAAIRDGVKDGSIKYDGDVDMLYRSTTLSLMSLCKKLASEGNLLDEDNNYDAVNEIKTLIDIFLYRIK